MNGKKNRKAYLFCKKEMLEHYKGMWNERTDIPIADNIKNAADLYVISQKDLSDDLKKQAVRMAENLRIRVHYLDRELVNEEAENYIRNSQKIRKKEMEL